MLATGGSLVAGQPVGETGRLAFAAACLGVFTWLLTIVVLDSTGVFD